MAVTRFQRKMRKLIHRADNRQQLIKQLTVRPDIKRIDVEAIKAEFEKK